MNPLSPDTRLFNYQQDKKTVIINRADRPSPKIDDDKNIFGASSEQRHHSFNKLIAVSGPFAGKACHIDREAVDVGRARVCAIQLDDPAVSAFHARITTGEDVCVITDLSSRNGTFINGIRITEPYALKTGDRIEMGDIRMVFLAKDGVISADELHETGDSEKAVPAYKEYTITIAAAAILLLFAIGGWLSWDRRTPALQASVQHGVIQASGIAPSLPDREPAAASPEKPAAVSVTSTPAVSTEKPEAKAADQQKNQQAEKKNRGEKKQAAAQQKAKKSEKSSWEKQVALALKAYEKGAISKAVRGLQKAAAGKKSSSRKKKLKQMAASMKKAHKLYKKGVKKYKRGHFQNALKNWKQALVINRELLGDEKGWIDQKIGQKIADEYCRRSKRAYKNGKPALAGQYLEIALMAFENHAESMKFKAVLSKK